MSLRDLGHKGQIIVVGDEAWPPYERPPLSKELLLGEIEPERTFLRTVDGFNAAGVELILGQKVDGIDRSDKSVHLQNGKSISYDTLLLATGGRLRKLACEGADHNKVHYLRGLDDALRLRAELKAGVRVAIIGGGLIGLEVAAAASKAGGKVTVLERSPQLVARLLHPEVSDVFADLHRANGINLHFETAVQRIENRDETLVIHTHDGPAIEVDIVVVGIGVEPNTLLAETTGLETDNGIVTDSRGRTSDKSIYAIGDVASRLSSDGQIQRIETWQNAQNQAVEFAKAVLGHPDAQPEPNWFWTDQYGVNFQFVGSTRKGEVVWRGDRFSMNAIGFHLEGDRLIGASCINPGREMRNVKRLVAQGVYIDRQMLADSRTPLGKISVKSEL